jgi:PD-(D/E)XK nuclease superfamily
VKRASYSALDLMDKCPRLYNERRNNHVIEFQSRPLAVGIASHAIIEDYLRHLAERNVISDRAAVTRLVAEYFSDENSEIAPVQYMDDVSFIVRQVADQFVYMPDASLEVEGWFEGQLKLDPHAEDSEEINVVGRLDLVYLDEKSDTIVGRDWKTGWATDANAYALQQLICGWLLRLRYGESRHIEFEFDFPRANYVTDRFRFKPYDFFKAEEQMRAIVKRIFAAEASNLWPEHPGDHCAYCPVAVGCSMRRGLTQSEQEVADAEGARLALLDCAVLDAALHRRKEALKRWTVENGPVTNEGLFAGMRGGSSTGVRDARALLDRLGIDDALPYLKINNKAKGIKKDGRIDDLRVTAPTKPKFYVGKEKTGASDGDDDDESAA